jgi:hypothetical protein
MTIKTFFSTIFLSSLMAVGLLLTPQPTLASGLQTNTASGSGRVGTTTVDGATYLTTSVNNQNGLFSNQGVEETFFSLPVGFARSLGIWITSVASLMIAIIVLLVFFQLIMGGFSWITSGGDKGKTDEARNRLVAAVIGLLIIAASYAILIVLLRFLGFESITDAFDNVRPINSSYTVLR